MGYCLQSIRQSQLTPNSPWVDPGGDVQPVVEGKEWESFRGLGAIPLILLTEGSCVGC